MDYIILLIGFAALIKGADFFVDGASSIAKKFGLPSILIGLTIVAFGTSAPEAAVSIKAALTNSDGIAVGNIIGSSIFNILIVIGVAAIIKPVRIKIKTILKEFPFLFLATGMLFVLSYDVVLQNAEGNILSRGDGIVLLSVFLVFIYYLVEMAVLSNGKSDDNGLIETDEIEEIPLSKSLFLTALGMIGIMIGAHWVVISSTSIAVSLGMSETLVGLTIVAIGTSLPELVTSMVAAFKGESDIAVGNAIGSNMFNIVFILGITSIIKPLPIESKVFFDMIFLIGATILTYIFATTGQKTNRFEGIFLSLAYIGYMIFILIRR
ncbi:calcium/sodium antiporter [Clostridium sp. D2Q-11]|uniref:Calcium/sodium antiporter n=1 Tax=Anaeromonas frigoriresistens TaxID=2683708 RepID=A0A942Z7C2_9FIRM|nr:calcium/sodium antiporter [Anaeromonas frigoriresistens]MBS4536825.1 calcium/sodium antiporter [Anaeromonas frigoriresistens]